MTRNKKAGNQYLETGFEKQMNITTQKDVNTGNI